MIDVSIIIVNYNSSRFLVNLVKSIYKFHVSLNLEIIIIDNASLDNFNEVSKQIKKIYPIKILSSQENVGFAMANNLAVKIAQGKYVLLLNPDTLFVDNSLERVFKLAEKISKPRIIGVKLLDENLNYQTSKQTFPNVINYLFQAFFLDSIFRGSKLFDRVYYGWQNSEKSAFVDSVKGAFLFVSKKLYDQLGGLDSDYFLYTEEVDFCFRAKNKGIKSYYFPEAKLVHFGGESMESTKLSTFIELYESKILFIKKHYSSLYSKFFKLILFIAAFNRTILNFILYLLRPSNPFYVNKYRLFLYSSEWFITGKIKSKRIILK